jgi:hypothetical protein
MDHDAVGNKEGHSHIKRALHLEYPLLLLVWYIHTYNHEFGEASLLSVILYISFLFLFFLILFSVSLETASLLFLLYSYLIRPSSTSDSGVGNRRRRVDPVDPWFFGLPSCFPYGYGYGSRTGRFS